MLDRVDARGNRGANALGAMRVRGDAQPPLMRLVGDRGELLLRHLQLARFGVARKDAAGRADLDHLGAIFALAADLIAKLVGRVAAPLRTEEQTSELQSLM